MKQLCRRNKNTDSESYSIPPIRNCGAYMRDIKQKKSITDKPMKSSLLRYVWLSYLLSLGTISSGGLSFFSVVTLLGIKPAQANVKQPSVNLPEPIFEEEKTLANNFDYLIAKIGTQSTESQFSNNHDTPEFVNDNLGDLAINSGKPTTQLKEFESKSPEKLALVDKSSNNHDTPEFVNGTLGDLATNSEKGVTALTITENISEGKKLEKLTLENKYTSIHDTPEFANDISVNLVTISGEKTARVKVVENELPEKLALVDKSPNTHDTPEFASDSLVNVASNSGEKANVFQITENEAAEKLVLADKSTSPNNNPELANDFPENLAAKSREETKPLKIIESKAPERMALGEQTSTVLPTSILQTKAKVETGIYKGPGAAALLLSNSPTLVSQQTTQQIAQQPVPATRQDNPFAPSLVFQGAYVYQGDSSARARLTGIYPVSPNALFGGTVDLGTGPDFSDSQAGSLRISELYFTGSLPSMPGLRMTVGLVDLTSYFDRNSFAKDVTTHFFNPVFQTNPALAMTGIGSRPAALLNWSITDNLEAKAAVFSSAESISNLGLNAFAGELAFRHGNGIIRATYATDRDVDKNGFKEIYGLKRNNGEIGPKSSDRESSYGINGEYFIPGLKMGLFGRYGRYENTSLGKGGNTYSVGLNFLDLFMRDDRLGLGYGRDLSNDELRRQTGKKVPDVWEAFYDFRISPILRAGLTLQAREQFSDIVAGFRVKTEFDVTSLLGGRK
jgi:hypothetical protein